jgi:RNA polymerase sigma-70 factor (ECF subfamily)
VWKGRPVPLFRQRTPQWDATITDEDLVVLAQRGERAAFGALYDRYLPRVYAYCYRLLGDREAAEDANTDVFMRALTALPVYRTGSFRSWLFAIAHNVVADARRQQRPTVPLAEAADLVDPNPSLEERVMDAADRSTIAALLPRLSADQQHVVALRLSGLSATEIGEAMGKPRNAIDGLHHRALLRLRSLMATGETTTTKGGG